ncbi:hypothetical protein KAR91_31435 [Candidatus Pacearchaeota archaeon]|nr:hypothetical protein [Candidatus Pacearchaeota archaeon]
MKVSDLIKKLEEFKEIEGDLDFEYEYWCPDHKTTYESGEYGVMRITRGKAKVYQRPF